MKKAGFTLLEVMIALAVLAFAVSALVGFQSRGIVMNARSRDLMVATSLARQKMEEIKAEVQKEKKLGKFPDEKVEEGKFEGDNERYRWKVEFKKVEIPAPPEGDGESNSGMMGTIVKMVSKQLSDSVREVTLTVAWEDLDKERSITVTTHFVKD